MRKVRYKMPMQLKRIALIMPLLMGGLYAGVLNVTTDATVDNLTIDIGDRMVLSTGITLTVNGNVVITGELEMADTSVVDAGGDVTVAAAGTLDMDGTARLMTEGDLTFNGTLEAESGTGIYLDGTVAQIISGDGTPEFDNLIFSGGSTVFELTATIRDSLDSGGQDFTISDGFTLTMNAGSVTKVSGGDWSVGGDDYGTLTLDETSKFCMIQVTILP
jgi:hypothetical protein